MKTLEKSLWKWLSSARRPGFMIQRIENTLSKSTPDVECSTGGGGFWIELKTAYQPKKEETTIRFKFQRGQSEWLVNRWGLDRGAWLLVQVGRDRYLIPGLYSRVLEDGITKSEIHLLSKTSITATAQEVLIIASDALRSHCKITS